MDGLMMRRHVLLARPLGSPLTVTGATPLLMPGAVSKPMRAATFAISPVQSGSGDPSPSNIRSISGHQSMTAWVTGRNLFNNAPVRSSFNGINYTVNEGNGKLIISGTATSTSYSGPGVTKETARYSITPGTYTLSVDNFPLGSQISYVNIDFYDVNGSQIRKQVYSNSVNYTTITLDSPMVYDWWISVPAGTYNNVEVGIQLEPGTTATPYTPYSGSTVSVSFPAMGKNLVNIPDNAKAAYYVPYISGDALATINALPRGANLYCGYKLNGTAASNCLIRVTYADNTTADITHNGGILSEGEITVARLYTFAPVGEPYNLTDVWVSKTQNDTYTPYTSTVYSGTIDPVTGQGVVDGIVLDISHDTARWEIQGRFGGNGFYFSRYLYGDDIPKFVASEDQMARQQEKYSQGLIRNPYTVVGDNAWAFKNNENYGTLRVSFADAEIDTLEKFNAWRAATNAQIYYPIATPTPFTISPQTLIPPAGDAYIWADCGGSAEVTYMGKA